MTFIRTKKIKNNLYAYAVENRLRRKKVKQTVKKYLGRVYAVDSKTSDFFDYFKINNVVDYLKNNAREKIIKDLIEFTIFSAGFKRSETCWINPQGFSFDFDNKKILKNKKNVVLKINEGFLCSETIQELFEIPKGNEQEVGLKLAKDFVNAGIKIPKEIFIGVFEKTLKN